MMTTQIKDGRGDDADQLRLPGVSATLDGKERNKRKKKLKLIKVGDNPG